MRIKTLVFNLVIATAAASLAPAHAKDGKEDFDPDDYSKYDWSKPGGSSLHVMPKERKLNFKEKLYIQRKKKREEKEKQAKAKEAE